MGTSPAGHVIRHVYVSCAVAVFCLDPLPSHADDHRIICLASDSQVASGETVLCKRGAETFYETLNTLNTAGWKLVLKLRIRDEEAHAFYLERPPHAANPGQGE